MSSTKAPPPDGDVDKGPLITALLSATTAIALLAVATRMFTRIKIVKNVGWDDYAILVSLVMAIAVMVFMMMAIDHGMGRHMYYLDPHDVIEAAKWIRASSVPNLLACLMARVSLCLSMMRIVNRVLVYKVILCSVMALNVLTTSASIIHVLAMCQPLEKLWNPHIPGKCDTPRSTLAFGLTQATSTIVSDWLVALLPALIVRNLNMALKTKIALSVLMGTGVFVGVASLLKTLQVYTLAKIVDQTWDTFTLNCWSIVEQNLGIIAVSVATIRPLFSRFLKMGTSPQRPSGDAGYDLGNMVGRKRGTVYANAVSIVSSARKPPADDTGSESNLVEGKGGDGITKTVSVSLESNVRDERNHTHWSEH